MIKCAMLAFPNVNVSVCVCVCLGGSIIEATKHLPPGTIEDLKIFVISH